MNVKIDQIWQFIVNRKKLIIRMIIISFILLFLFFTDYGFIKTFSLMIEKSELYQSIDQQEKIKDSLKNKIIKLTNDSLEIERIAREHYGLVKPGERVFVSSEK